MSLSTKITVNSHYTRSVNLERDANSPAIVNGYLPTSRALQTLSRIADSMAAEEAPRAWSLVGPYGSGKSSFAAFLTYLLAAPDGDHAKSAQRVLQSHQPQLAARFSSLQQQTRGHCTVILTGSPEPFSQRLAQALTDGAATFWSKQSGRKPAIVGQLRKLAAQDRVSATELIDAVIRLQDAIARHGGNGLLIVLDELGKFLEYEARHSGGSQGANDIFLLQVLAERANAAHTAKLTLVVLLHQAMDQYAKGLGEALCNEWAKVQGRFENISFIESAEQVLRIVAAAFSQTLSIDEQARVNEQATAITAQLAKADALPKSLDQAAAAELFARCYPLHPLSAMLLPTLCQKVAQNERTLFSYLGSHEPHGFNDSLQRLSSVDDWVLPWEIYEYFIRNQSGALSDHYTRRRWNEVVTAVERLGDAPEQQIQLLKSIGLFNIIGAQGGLKASREIVRLCASTPKKATTLSRNLLDKSVLQYRKFSGEFRVWEGSDFDLDSAVEAQVERLGHFNLANALNKRHALKPIVARRHSIASGALRYFIPTFANGALFAKLPEQADTPRIIFFLVDGPDEQQVFHEQVIGHFSTSDLVVACANTEQLQQAVAEVQALDAVRRELQAINTDPVAEREFKDRYAVAVSNERELLASLTEDPRAGTWCWKGEILGLSTKRRLQAALSDILDQVYHAAPIIRNELINREKPSAQAAAARNKLLASMLHKESEPGLGITKYPPEKAIYQALLRETGIHRKVDGQWQITAPNGYNLAPVWERIEQFLDDTQPTPQPFTDLSPLLQAPPYGVKAGVLPILYIAAYLAKQDEIALFEEGRYTPYLTDDQLERFVRRPGDFTVQSFKLEGLRASIFKEYKNLLYGSEDRERTLLSIARPLAKFMGDLSDYARVTKRISPTAQQVRSAFSLAKSPQTLLFEQLPAACGLQKLDAEEPDEAGLKAFSNQLKAALRELKQAYPDLLDSSRELMAQAFNLDRNTQIDELRAVLRGRLDGLDSYTVDVDGLRAFIRRAIKPTGSDDEWFGNLLMFLGHKPARKWTDTDADAAEFRLSEFAHRLNDLEKLRVHYEGEQRKHGADFDVLLLRSVRKGKGERDELVSIDDKRREAFKTVKEGMENQLAELDDRELRLAVLAELVDEFLSKRNSRHHVDDGVDSDDMHQVQLISGGSES